MSARIFLSSVVHGFEDYRSLARNAIEEAGHIPVLSEDTPSLDSTPLNACLDLIVSCDAFIAVLGEDPGFVTESEKTVVEEEFDEAQRLGKPSLIFLMESEERDARQEKFVRKVSDFVTGRFRKTFTDPTELKEVILEALKMIDLRTNENPQKATQCVNELMGQSLFDYYQYPILRSAICPARIEDVVGARLIQDEQMPRQLLELGRRDNISLLSPYSAYIHSVSESTLMVKSEPGTGNHGAHHEAGIALTVSGAIAVEVNVTGLHETEKLGYEPLLVDDVVTQLNCIMKFISTVYDTLDYQERQQRFMYNTGLFYLGYRYLEESPPTESVPMRMDGGEEALAYESSRGITRNQLRNPDDISQDVIARLRLILHRR